MYDDGYSFTLEQHGDWRVRLVVDLRAGCRSRQGKPRAHTSRVEARGAR